MATYATFALAQAAAAANADYASESDVTKANTYRDALESMLLLGLDGASMAGRSYNQSRDIWQKGLDRVNEWLDEHGGARVSNSRQAWVTRGRPV